MTSCFPRVVFNFQFDVSKLPQLMTVDTIVSFFSSFHLCKNSLRRYEQITQKKKLKIRKCAEKGDNTKI